MSRHEGVSCDNCLTSNFRQIRFKCLICYDYDLCEDCYLNNVCTSRHSPSHPMQCILTRHDFDLYYGGEGISMDNPPSLTCPLCGKHGLTRVSLQEHVNAQHLDNTVEVVCPICAAIPTGDPNHVTDDFSTHLAIEHNSTQRGADEQIGGRHMQRMFYPGRSIRGARAQRSANMNFTSGPTSVPGFSNTSNSAGTNAPQTSDAMDPIAELLSQLSGVRRNAQQLQQSVSTASQLQELQAQLQLERQRASIIRQQLERFPGKLQTQHGNQASNQTANSQIRSYANVAKVAKADNSSTTSEEDSWLLLSQIHSQDSSDASESKNTNVFERSLFIQELIMSLPTKPELTYPEPHPISGAPALKRAVPVGCAIPESVSPSQSLADGAGVSSLLDAPLAFNAPEPSRVPRQSMNVNTLFKSKEVDQSEQPPHDAGTSPETIEGSECNGIHLPDETPEEVAEIKKEAMTQGPTLHQSQFSTGADHAPPPAFSVLVGSPLEH